MGVRKGHMTIEQMVAALPGYLPVEARPMCRNCGSELKVMPLRESGETGRFYVTEFPETADKVGYGYNGDGHFCRLRCGYEFGCAAALGWDQGVNQ